MKKFAVFDLDGTLYDTHLGVELLRELASRGAIPGVDGEKFDKVYRAWKNSPDRTDYYDQHLDVYYNERLVGVLKHEFDVACHHIADAVLRHTYTELYDRLKSHKRDGYVIIIISKSPKPAVEAVASRLGADYIWGWEFSFDDGVYSGQYTYSDGSSDKEVIVRDIVSKNNLTFDDSYGYGDSRGDISVLQLVDHPVCVNPDRFLKEAAESRGWKILNPQSTSGSASTRMSGRIAEEV